MRCPSRVLGRRGLRPLGTCLQDSRGPAFCLLAQRGPALQASGDRAVMDGRQEGPPARLGLSPHPLPDPLPELLRLNSSWGPQAEAGILGPGWWAAEFSVGSRALPGVVLTGEVKAGAGAVPTEPHLLPSALPVFAGDGRGDTLDTSGSGPRSWQEPTRGVATPPAHTSPPAFVVPAGARTGVPGKPGCCPHPIWGPPDSGTGTVAPCSRQGPS